MTMFSAGGPQRGLLVFLVLVLLPSVAPLPRAASSSGPSPEGRQVAGVYVDEHAGALTEAEEALLRRLAGEMLPLPDTIRIRVDTMRYGAYAPFEGELIYLSADRFRPPDSMSRTAPYLFGRVEASPAVAGAPAPQYTHTLAHELAHFLSSRLSVPRPRPAWGTARTLRASRRAREVEAELIAAALQQIAFGTRPSALGYPDTVTVHGVGARSTYALVQEYRGIIADTWRLPTLGS